MPAISVYLTPAEEEVLAPRFFGGEGAKGDRSAVIQRIIGRYGELVRRSLPDLTVEEWKLIVDSLNGVLHEQPAGVASAWTGVEDSIRLDRLDAKWGVDGPALIEKLRALGFAGSVTVVDVVERYWTAVRRGEQPKVPGEA